MKKESKKGRTPSAGAVSALVLGVPFVQLLGRNDPGNGIHPVPGTPTDGVSGFLFPLRALLVQYKVVHFLPP